MRRAIDGRDDRPRWLHRLAVCLAQQGKCRAALPWLDRAIALDASADRLMDRAMCQLVGGHFEAAEKDLLAAVALSPEEVRGWVELGRIAHQRGDDTLAERRLRRASTLDAHNVEARFLLAKTSLAQGRVRQAVADLRRVIAQVPGHTGATYSLGRALLALGETAEGHAWLNQFRRLRRQDDLLDNHLQGLQLHPADVDLRLASGRLLLAMGRLGEAVEQLEIARRLAPRQAEVHRLLSRAYALSGRPVEAAEAERRARRLDDEGTPLPEKLPGTLP